MTDLGNRATALRLQCRPCEWRPPEDMSMEGVLLHVQVEHDTDEVLLDLVPVCTCGATMTTTRTHRPGPGTVKDSLTCAACGNTGWVRRKDTTT